VPSPEPSPAAPPELNQLPALQINFCNGRSAEEGANFRSAPTMTHEAILGVVEQGSLVRLTGGTFIDSAGNFWLEVVNPEPLRLSANPFAQNLTDANQVGWISDCFTR
jgi:hypothetical protein